jgi:hypothetical protein
MEQEVWLMNLRSYMQKVATDTIRGFGREHKFHFTPIPESWFKVDVRVALVGDVASIFPNEDAEQMKVKDVIGSSAIWDSQYIKCATCVSNLELVVVGQEVNGFSNQINMICSCCSVNLMQR